MKRITNKEYETYRQLYHDKITGRILTIDGLRCICQSCNYDAEQIGLHMLEVLSKFNVGGMYNETDKKNEQEKESENLQTDKAN